MNSIGERLRQERLRRGLDLSQIADLTKIQPTMLEAIEADDLDRLPGTFFTRSFVRQYARALGLDEGEFENELKRLTSFDQSPAPEAAAYTPSEPEYAPLADPLSRPGGSHSLGSLIAFLLIVAACSVIYMVWQRTRETPVNAPLSTAAAQHPAPVHAPETAPTPPPESTPAPAPRPEATAPAPAPAESAQPQPATPAPVPNAPAEPSAGAPAAAVRVEVRATEPAWIRVLGDGKYLFSGTLQPNETRAFDAARTVRLRTGNAGGITVVLNGKLLEPLGPAGQIRDVELTPEGVRVPAPPPPEPVTPGDVL